VIEQEMCVEKKNPPRRWNWWQLVGRARFELATNR